MIESWGQPGESQISTSRSGRAAPPSAGVEKEFIRLYGSGVVTNGFFVKNYTGYWGRSLGIIDYKISYVPNTSRRVLGISGFFFLEKPLLRGCHSSPVRSGLVVWSGPVLVGLAGPVLVGPVGLVLVGPVRPVLVGLASPVPIGP